MYFTGCMWIGWVEMFEYTVEYILKEDTKGRSLILYKMRLNKVPCGLQLWSERRVKGSI